MWEASYGKEPFDLRITVLRMFRRLGLILAVTLAGTLVFGGGYYVKNILLRPEPAYSVTSIYRVEYAVAEEKDVSTVHINEMTWNTYVDTQMFLDEVRKYLPADAAYTDTELTEALSAVVPSNLKVISTVVTTESQEQSLEIAEAVEKALVQDFPDQISEIISISVIDPGGLAEEVYPNVRLLRAVILSALLSFFFVTVILLLQELGDDSIWLPAILRQRYSLQAVGTLHSPELAENIGYLFRGKNKIAVCPVQDQLDPSQVLAELKEACSEPKELWEDKEWFPVPSPILCPESCQSLRTADGILLVVAAGSHAGKQLEYTLEFLGQQDCKITGVMLWNADEFLLKVYYGFQRTGRF